MTKEVSILNTKGSAVGQIALDEKVFGVEPNLHVMHLALRRQLNNGRAGSACTKQEQKYLAAAENPGNKKVQVEQEPVLFVHHYLQAAALSSDQNLETTVLPMPQKARRLALKSALSARIDNTVLVKDFSEINEPKTKLMAETLKALKVEGKILIIADVKAAENAYLELSARNLPNVRIILPSNLNVKDLLEADNVIITEAAINEITERLSK